MYRFQNRQQLDPVLGKINSVLSLTSYFFHNIFNLKLMLMTIMVVVVVAAPLVVAAVLVVRLIYHSINQVVPSLIISCLKFCMPFTSLSSVLQGAKNAWSQVTGSNRMVEKNT
jgi:hypothetical protein